MRHLKNSKNVCNKCVYDRTFFRATGKHENAGTEMGTGTEMGAGTP